MVDVKPQMDIAKLLKLKIPDIKNARLNENKMQLFLDTIVIVGEVLLLIGKFILLLIIILINYTNWL